MHPSFPHFGHHVHLMALQINLVPPPPCIAGNQAALIEMPSPKSWVLVSIVGVPRAIVRAVPLQSFTLLQQAHDWTPLLCLSGHCALVIKLEYWHPLDEV